ncbi:MAG: DUF6351 family protein, partial [Haliea sp.]
NPDSSVGANRPASAEDSCFDSTGELIASGASVWDGILDDQPAGACTKRFPPYSTSRIVAGGPITGDVFRCALQSLDDAIEAGFYGDWMPSAAEQTKLAAIFPDGVCDYSQPGIVN